MPNYFGFSRKKQSMPEMIPSENSLPRTDAPEQEPVSTEEESVSEIALSIEGEPVSEPEVSHDDEAAISTAAEKSSVILPADSNLPVSGGDMFVVLRQLAKDFETKLKYDASKQELIDKLYKENLAFKEGIVKKFQHAMILAVIEKIDEADKDIAVFENREFSDENYRKLLASYNEIATGFQDMLSARFDVECYSSETLTNYDPKIQRSLKTCPTHEADKNKLVKRTLRPGYKTAEGFVLRPELVEVYVFDEKTPIPPVSEFSINH